LAKAEAEYKASLEEMMGALEESTQQKRVAEAAMREAERSAAASEARAALAEDEVASWKASAAQLQGRLEDEVAAWKDSAAQLQRRLEAAEQKLQQRKTSTSEEAEPSRPSRLAKRGGSMTVEAPLPAENVVAARNRLESAVKAAKEATERADTAEARSAVLTEKLSTADVQVKMLRQQIHKLQDQVPTSPGPGRLPPAHRGLHGKLYHPSASAPHKLPKLGAKPPMDLRPVEEGLSSAFPDYGGKSGSGLRARPVNVHTQPRAKQERAKANTPKSTPASHGLRPHDPAATHEMVEAAP